jgi:hypothetical protein
VKKVKPLVAFIHIEKAAGTTFIHILRHNFFLAYADVRPFFKESGGLFTDKDMAVMRQLMPGLRCLGGHSVVPYNNLLRSEPDAHLITIMRDPVKRYLSQYQHWVEKKKLDISFEDFLAREELWNLQTRKYAGEPSLEKAKKILRKRFLLVGCVEAYDEFLVMLQHKLSFMQFDASYRQQNLAHSKGRVDQTEERYRDQIEERNLLDIQLYQFVREELFPQYIEEYGAAFDSDVQVFQQHNLQFEPPMARRYVDYLVRKLYVEPVTGLVRKINGKPYEGSY